MATLVSTDRSVELARQAVRAPGRGVVDGLISPRPLVEQLPSVLQEDDFCQRFSSAFDDALAPIFNTLDCWDSYLDAHLTPDDFVDWLASWVGVDIDETWTLEQRRHLITQIVALYRIRGTAAGLAAHIGMYAGVTPQITDSGGCEWSQTANSALPGSADPNLVVTLQTDDPAAINARTVERIVDASRPAHVPFAVEVTAAGAKRGTGRRVAAEEPHPDGGDGEVAADAPGAVSLPGSATIELAPQGPESWHDAEAEAERSEPSASPDQGDGDGKEPGPGDGKEPPS